MGIQCVLVMIWSLSIHRKQNYTPSLKLRGFLKNHIGGDKTCSKESREAILEVLQM
jgi:hypothetical protein